MQNTRGPFSSVTTDKTQMCNSIDEIKVQILCDKKGVGTKVINATTQTEKYEASRGKNTRRLSWEEY